MPAGFDQTLVADGTNARDRFLKPGGRMVPAAVDVELGPVEDAVVYDQIEFWARHPAGFEFAPARRWAANSRDTFCFWMTLPPGMGC